MRGKLEISTLLFFMILIWRYDHPASLHAQELQDDQQAVRIKELEDKLHIQNALINELSLKVKEHDKMMAKVTALMEQKSAIGPSAFIAFASGERTYNPEETVIFDGVVTNLGGHYDAVSSTFTCPFTGLYVFGVNVVKTDQQERVHVSIVLDDALFLQAYVDKNTGLNLGASNFGATQCNAGQKVWVKATNECKLYGLIEPRVTFIGFYLYS